MHMMVNGKSFDLEGDGQRLLLAVLLCEHWPMRAVIPSSVDSRYPVGIPSIS